MIDYQFNLWKRNYWESETRYYLAELKQDIFGGWCISCTWGGTHNRLGSSKTYPVNSYEDGEGHLRNFEKRRTSRCYRRIEDHD